MVTVSLQDVSKQVDKTVILDNLNLSIKNGEFMVVVGPSGCGKSTLLRLIAGLEEVSSGKILINDVCINNVSPAKRDMAMVFQNYALYPHMTVFDNMAYALKMRKVSKEDINKRVKAVANLLQLSPYLDRKPAELSGGQKQRVGMGRAIIRSPSVFLFDEPLSNLDAKLRTEMRHEIKNIHKKFKITSLYVTHDQTEAMTMAERVLVLNHGVMEQVGTPQELYQTPASLFVAGFTGHYPINFINGIYNKTSSTIATGLGLEHPVLHELNDKTEVVLAIRPEHLELCTKDHSKAVELKIEFIDDMGADKLIQAKSTRSGERFTLRLPSEQELKGDQLYVALPSTKIHLFHKQSGKRIGE
ncbi:MAG: sn-glycerol-3-phosphate ABC transporter ATP-binding protein UgpC [Legionella sp.]|jgi:sn-glycerol 3-phosphate transport system ATP-binding protein